MTVLRSTPLLFLTLATLLGQAPAKAPPKPEKKSGWVLELLPRAFQKNPNLDITVISELSPAGKQRPTASIDSPVYYLAHPAGYQARGEPTQQKPFPAEDVEKILRRSLGNAGYLPATAEHPPSLLVVYFWGAHNVIDAGNALSTDDLIRNVMDRASLVGGDKFARELGQAIRDSQTAAEATAPPPAAGEEGTTSMSAATTFATMSALNDPVARFRRRSVKNDFLVSQASSNCYYIVATAYDYESIANPPRVLLWRVRMTVSSDGVTQLDAIPTMITAASPYFGKDMPESEVITKPAVPLGKVEVGMPTVIPPPAPKPVESSKDRATESSKSQTPTSK